MAEEIYMFKDNTLSGCLRSELYTHICIKIFMTGAQNGGGKILVLRQYSKHVCLRYELYTLISIKICMTGAQNGRRKYISSKIILKVFVRYMSYIHTFL